MSGADRNWAVVPAAGSGSRLPGTVPKQYRELKGASVIELTLRVMLAENCFAGLIVVLSRDDGWWPDTEFANDHRVHTAFGGSSRSESVLQGLHRLRDLNVHADELVAVHDAARPCLSRDDLRNVLAAAARHEHGALLAAPVADTLKRSVDKHEVAETVPRERLWRALTPQVFRHGVLTAALEAARREGHDVTDEAQAMELQGYRPLLVAGRGDNIKITQESDLAIAGAILSASVPKPQSNSRVSRR